MSEFRGVRCDKCGTVIEKSEATRKTVRIDGPDVSGEYAEDLCRSCTVLPEGVTLRPLRRRAHRTSA